MKREYNTECTTGKPRVAFRETITQRANFDYTHKKQTGGAGQYAKVIGYIEPMEPDAETGTDTGFESVVMGGNIPSNYIPAVEKVQFFFRRPPSSAKTKFCFIYRDFSRLWRRERCQGIRSQAVALYYKMVLSTLLTRPSWPSDWLRSVLFVKRSSRPGLLSLNLS
jgi:hypothetical protein